MKKELLVAFHESLLDDIERMYPNSFVREIIPRLCELGLRAAQISRDRKIEREVRGET